MRKRKVAITFASVLILSSVAAGCGGSDNAASRTKNAATEPTLINPTFTAAGGGWTGNGFALNEGCASSSAPTYRPSLGVWAKNSLAFGYRSSSVSQSVTIPNPSTVQFSITGAVRGDDSGGWFSITAKDGDENRTTGPITGSAAVTPASYEVLVTTTTANETLTITLTGSGKNAWRGCYGPMLSNASLTIINKATTTTLTTPSTTTSTSSTTLAPTTSTTTPIPRTTTTAAPGTTCRLKWDGKVLTACKPIKKIFGYYEGYSVTTDSRFQSEINFPGKEFWIESRFGTARLVINIIFDDGTSVANARISYLTDEYADSMNYPRSTVDAPFAATTPTLYFAAPATPTPAPVTSSISGTSSLTTPTSTTTTVARSTTTTIPRTTTTAAPGTTCRLKWDGKVLTACKPIKKIFGYYEGYSVTTDSRFQSEINFPGKEFWIESRFGTARLVINIIFDDGTSVANARISYLTDEYADSMNYPRSTVDAPFATKTPTPYFG